MKPILGSTELLKYSTVGCNPTTTSPDTPRTTYPQFPNLQWRGYRPPLGDHLAQETLFDMLGAIDQQWRPVLSSGQLPELDPVHERPVGSFLNWFQTFADDQNRGGDTRSVQDQVNSPRFIRDQSGADLPFAQENDTYLHGLDTFFNGSHCQSSQGSPQQFENTTGTHPISPIPGQHHWDQVVDAEGFPDPQQVSETRVVKHFKHGGKRPKKWACNHSGCDKRYQRKQELKRHTKDKHEDPDSCPFCCFTWTRPDRMGSHLLGQHGSQFTKEECREIRGLRGRDVMIFFLAKCRTTRVPSNNASGERVPSPSRPFFWSIPVVINGSID